MSADPKPSRSTSRRAKRRFAPNGEEHRAFQDESVAVGALRQTVQKPLDCLARQRALEFLSLCLGAIEKTLPDGSGDVPDLLHDSASM
jgi:hypothetical protein